MRTHRALSLLLLPLSLPLLILFPPPSQSGAVDHREAFSRLPPGEEILYLPERFSACLSCHPKELVEAEDFNVDTRFRDTGLGKNLHWIHINRLPQGTNCSACHHIDAGTGALSHLPGIRLEMSGQGGRCSPACHRPKVYGNTGRKR